MADDKPMQIGNLNEAPAIFADVFLVSGDPEAGNFSVYFCQKNIQLPMEAKEGSVEVPGGNEARCVARVVLTEKGLDALLDGLQKNKDFTNQIRRQKGEKK